MVSQKAEMKRKLAAVTPEIYNSLDLLVDSAEFAQVMLGLMCPISGELLAYFADVRTLRGRTAFQVERRTCEGIERNEVLERPMSGLPHPCLRTRLNLSLLFVSALFCWPTKM